MLVLTRRIGEEIVIDDTIRITVVAVQRGRVRLGFTAPPSASVVRQEVLDRRAAEAARGANRIQEFIEPPAGPASTPATAKE